MKNFIWETINGKLTERRVQCILCPNIIHQKLLWEKMDDMITFIWETQRENSYKEKSVIWCLQKLLIRETLPLIANLKVNSYKCTQHIRNVEYGRFYEYLCKIITRLSLQMFICPYYLCNKTILVQNIALSITCLHLHNTSCITFIDNDHWFIESTPHNFSMWYIILWSFVQYNVRMIGGNNH